MKDVVSLNRGFLHLARTHADDPLTSLAMGIPEETLKLLKGLTHEQVDVLAETLPLSVYTMRLNPSQLDLVAKDTRGTASRFMVSTLAANSKREVGVVA